MLTGKSSKSSYNRIFNFCCHCYHSLPPNPDEQRFLVYGGSTFKKGEKTPATTTFPIILQLPVSSLLPQYEGQGDVCLVTFIAHARLSEGKDKVFQSVSLG